MAEPVEVDIHIYRGEDYTLALYFWQDAAHTIPKNMAGRVFKSQVRPRPNHETLLAEFTIDDAEAVNGQVTISLSKAQTETLRRDCAWDFEQVVGGKTTTLYAGVAFVGGQVTTGA